MPDLSGLSIDLGKKNTDNASDLTFKWIVNSGKIIIVIVELLTLSALSFRFYIDRQIVDTKDQIEKQEIFVNAQVKKEALYRNLQERLNTIQKVSEETTKETQFVQQVTTLTNSSDFIESTVNASPEGINIDGKTYSIFTINSLVDTLEKNSEIKSVSLDELTSEDQGIKFRINALFAKTK